MADLRSLNIRFLQQLLDRFGVYKLVNKRKTKTKFFDNKTNN